MEKSIIKRLRLTGFGNSSRPSGSSSKSCCSGCAASYSFSAAASFGSFVVKYRTATAAAIGSALADLLGGYTLYILPTFVIKGLVAAVAVCALRARHPYWLTVALLVLAALVMVAGYFVTEWLLLGYGLAAAAGAVVPNLVQGFSGVVLGAVLIPLLRRVTPPAMRL